MDLEYIVSLQNFEKKLSIYEGPLVPPRGFFFRSLKFCVILCF